MAWMQYLRTYLIANEKEEGQGMVEYGLIIALVSVVAIVILGTLGTGIVDTFTEASDSLGGGGGT